MPEHGGDLHQALGDVGLARRLQLGQQRQHVARFASASTLGRQALANLLVERDQPDRVLLMDHQVAQRRGQADAVFELRQLLAIRVAHRAAQIHHQVAGDVGLGLELLDVVLVGLGVDQPVDVSGSSPGVYLRCSLNSTEKPWNGLACSPCKKPLTMNCARRSSREIWRMTSGFRYFSTVDMAIDANDADR